MAHQYIAQLDPDLFSAIRGNVGTLAAFRLGTEDAKTVAEELQHEVTASYLQRLPMHHVALRLLVRGESKQPFVAETLPPPKAPPVPGTLLRISRERYARPAAAVDREIEAALGMNARAHAAPTRGLRFHDLA